MLLGVGVAVMEAASTATLSVPVIEQLIDVSEEASFRRLTSPVHGLEWYRSTASTSCKQRSSMYCWQLTKLHMLPPSMKVALLQ